MENMYVRNELTPPPVCFQPLLPGDEPTYEGVGFYVAEDDHSLELRDVCCESGFRRKEEVRDT